MLLFDKIIKHGLITFGMHDMSTTSDGRSTLQITWQNGLGDEFSGHIRINRRHLAQNSAIDNVGGKNQCATTIVLILIFLAQYTRILFVYINLFKNKCNISKINFQICLKIEFEFMLKN